MIYDPTKNSITSGEDIQEFFYQASPDEISGVISDLVDHILAGDFDAYWNDYSYPIHGGTVDSKPFFFYEYLEYIKRARSLHQILSPNNNDAGNLPNTHL